MKTIRFSQAADFLQSMRPLLEAEEATYNLMLGVALRLEANPPGEGDPPWMGVVEEGGQIRAAGLQTPPHNLIVYTREGEEREALECLAATLQAEGQSIPGVIAPSRPAGLFDEIWCARTGQVSRLVMHERVYELRAVSPLPPVPGEMRAAVEGDLDLLFAWIAAFSREATPHEPELPAEAREGILRRIQAGDFFLWIADGSPVSLAGRTRPTPHGWAVGPVYTPPALRGRGYATALVAELSRLILAEGKEYAALFTDLSNPTSNSIYQKIGYRPLCDFDMFRFETP